MSGSAPRVVVALDYAEAGTALAFADQVSPRLCRLKIGKELFTRAGPGVVRELVARGYDVFLDLKFHDIPNTVAGAVRAAAELGVWMVNVHAAGGPRMLEAAGTARADTNPGLHLIAVTVLTSLDEAELRATGVAAAPAEQAGRLARLSAKCGLDGVVCSARDLAGLRTSLPADFLYVTPGIRPAGTASDDQQRIMSPAQALAAGASYLVIGRPVTRAPDPCQALLTINAETADS